MNQTMTVKIKNKLIENRWNLWLLIMGLAGLVMFGETHLFEKGSLWWRVCDLVSFVLVVLSCFYSRKKTIKIKEFIHRYLTWLIPVEFLGAIYAIFKLCGVFWMAVSSGFNLIVK
jgi:uncharacterized membrane protein